MQRDKGDEAAAARTWRRSLHPEKLAPVFAEAAQPDKHDLVLVSGVGSVWPLLRAHTLLNNLHTVMGKTPLVMFYPGRYDGQSLRLFGKTARTTTTTGRSSWSLRRHDHARSRTSSSGTSSARSTAS